jgi:head-tail adaptor
MREPKLTRALMLETPISVPDGAGGMSVSWVALGTLWAQLRAGTGREVQASHGPSGLVRHKITTRAAPEGSEQRPRPEQRFREGTRLWRITAVAEADAEGRYLVCTAEEEAPA